MSGIDVKTLLLRQSRRHIFRVFRRQARYAVVPVWLAFAGIDYVYRPDLWFHWFVLRIICLVFWFCGLPLLKISVVRRKYHEALAVAESAIAANAINVMVAMSGGPSSSYIPGVILTAVSCVTLFRLSWRSAFVANILSYGPCIGIMWVVNRDADWRLRAVQSGLLMGMIILSMIFRNSEALIESLWAKARINLDGELAKARKTEFLKKHFPAGVREAIENGTLNFAKKQIIPSAVVGFADISSSTEIANHLDLTTDWELKERFLSVATKRATECGLIVLTHTGDGFLFLANFFDSQQWTYNLVAFYEGLQLDFEGIKESLSSKIAGVETGIKCAVAMGPSVMGFIGEGQSYFTIMGPTVNLAARLCSKAAKNEIVVSSRVWDVLKHVMIGWKTNETVYDSLKGFDHSIKAMHISPRTSASKKSSCPDCGSPLTVLRTAEGFIDVLCPNCHVKAPQNAA